MANKNDPPKMTATPEEIAALETRLGKKEILEILSQREVKIILNCLRFNTWLQERLSRAKLTIGRLRRLFGFTSEKNKKQKPDNPDDNSGKAQDTSPVDDDLNESDSPSEGASSEKNDETAVSNKASNEPVWNAEANHGRYGAVDYTGCPVVDIPFEDPDLKKGLCPHCAESNTEAKIYSTAEPPMVVLLKGSPLISGHCYRLESARCSVCQARFTASLPAELEEQPKYDKTCYTSIAVHHYYAGLPFKRIEMLQSAQGIPLADATQYDLMECLYQGTVKPVYQALEHCAAQGRHVWFDDTPQRVLSQIALNKALETRKNKKSVYTTAFLSDYQGHLIYLFRTSTRTAGAELKELFSQRETPDRFISMSDASSRNFPELDNPLLARWIISLCMSHARRNFVELIDDEDARFVLSIIAAVYQNEAHCKKEDWDDVERLAYHQENSGPLMESLRIWLNNLILFKSVEPNSVMGEAIAYLLRRWEWFTQFLRVPGAMIDNNILEQSVKVVIRYRKNSYFYRTFFGAMVGDAMMSLLHTAAQAKIRIFDYFNDLQRYSEEVNTSPEKWLPWNYQETIKQREAQAPKVMNSS